MTDRDRLIELITKEVKRPKADALADHLLANGVFILPEDLRGTDDFSISAFIEAMQMYKEKDRYIKLPCKVGDYVLWDNGLKDSNLKLKEVKGFYYNTADLGLRYVLEGCQPIINFSSIVGVVPKEQAEAMLKELGK